jgi:pantoate--beta-alanine ligase
METVARIAEVRERVAAWQRGGEHVGLVPTMGNLHAGHLSLVRLARQHCDRVVVSIFVNPLQFGPQEDFGRYPRTPERDSDLLAQAGAQLLFSPAPAEIYPEGTEQATVVVVPALDGILEGAHRPGHFTGVATVVARLFNIVTPDVAAFGEKDFQQLAVIERMVRDLCMPVAILRGPIARDPDGLALSSRNQYLSAAERQRAPRLHEFLLAARRSIAGGRGDWAAIEAAGLESLRQAGFAPDYFSLRRAGDLALPRPGDRQLVLLAAARLGRTRLIDNVRVDVTT